MKKLDVTFEPLSNLQPNKYLQTYTKGKSFR